MITISIYTLVILFFAHWIGDFVLQTSWMGNNKSKQWMPLLSHIAVYTFTLWAFTYYMHTSYSWWVWFVTFNGIAHLLIDAYTSQLSSECYKKDNIKGFFTTIGFDQFLHSACLISSAGALLK